MAKLHTEPLCTKDCLLDWFKPDERELARHDDPEKTLHLGENMLARGQLQEVAATESGKLIFGHGRLLAAKRTGRKSLRAKIYPDSLPDTECELIRAADNLHHNKLTGYRKWLLCSGLMAMNPEWRQKDLAEALNVSEKMVTVNLSPSSCTQAWQEALKENLVGISHCYEASKLRLEEQAALLSLKLSGASRAEIGDAGRRSRNAKKNNDEAGKAAKVQCLLPTGVQITVRGKGLTLATAIEALTDAIKEMRVAKANGYSAKTFAISMAEKAKAKQEKANATENEVR